ncbi:MAG: LysR substrate-binding protein [Ramlibacter sp.]|nr:LysR substrate-binding protein [Ramlibacter sp.]
MALTSRSLQAFLVVAEELHFGRAARRLHMSQPPLSQQIRQFEHEVGASLFTRTTRSVQLTPAGRLLFERGRQLLADGEAAARAAQRLARGEAGRMTLGFTHSTVYEVLPRALQAFRGRYPDVELELKQFTSGLLVEGVRAGRVDAALVRFSPSMQDPELRSTIIARDPMLLVMPSDHPLAELAAVPVDALHGLPFVGYSAEDSRYFHDLVEALFARHGVRPEVVHTSFLPTLVALVEARMGVALVPAPAVPRGAGALVARPLAGVADGLDRADLHCVLRSDNANPVVRSFVDVLLPAGHAPPHA